MTRTRFFRTVVLLSLFFAGLSFQSAYAKATLISLQQPTGKVSLVNISKGSAVKVTNDFKRTLYNLRIVVVATGKKMMGIKEFQSGQAFNLEFIREGAYAICYSLQPESESESNPCFQVKVGAPLKA